MKKLLQKAVSISAIIALSCTMSISAMAAAPYQYFKQEVEGFLNEGDQVMKFDLILPKYIGSFTTEITLGTESSRNNEKMPSPFRTYDTSPYTRNVKIAVVRANPSTGKNLPGDPVPELKDSIIEYARIPSGKIIDTFEGAGGLWFVIPYKWIDETSGTPTVVESQGKGRSEEGINILLSESSNYLISASISVPFTDEHGDAVVATGNEEFASGFDYILPLTEEDEAYFLETGKFNIEDWGWSKIDWSGLRTVLTNPEAAPDVDISLDMTSVRTYQAEPSASTVRILQLNDKEVQFHTYRIQGHLCYRLGDVLAAINGSPNQADITIHPETNKMDIVKGQPYTLTGKEFQATDGTMKTAEARRMILCGKSYDGRDTMWPYIGYIIDGEYYFSLNDIKNMVGFELFKGEYPKNILPKIEAGKPDDMLQIY